MAKELKAEVKLQIAGASATPAPPVGSSLGPHGINLMEFCKQFNAQSANRKGETVPVVIKIYKDKSFTFELKTPPVSELIKKEIKVDKGSSRPNTQKVGKISWSAIARIATIKMPDLNVADIEQAKKIIAGSARSMGIDVID